MGDLKLNTENRLPPIFSQVEELTHNREPSIFNMRFVILIKLKLINLKFNIL
jgi:hypothetical protein